MYWVSGGLTSAESRISCSVSGLRRHARGWCEPLRKARAATIASARSEIPCSYRYRRVLRAKNWVVSIMPVSAYQSPRP
jgi:hypothetical protein